jgi:hypothetical protein
MNRKPALSTMPVVCNPAGIAWKISYIDRARKHKSPKKLQPPSLGKWVTSTEQEAKSTRN